MEKKLFVYELDMVHNGGNVATRKKFFSRDRAIEYAIRQYNLSGLDFQVEDIIEKGSKHILEYIFNNYNRFTVARRAIA